MSEQTITGALQAIEADDTPRIFVLKSARVFSASEAKIAQAVWEQAGGHRFGPLLVLDGGIEITALTGRELRELGLVRIEEAAHAGA